ncbi:MAG: hypothetical protein A2007_04230 [Verrucomicrobia bacterium GWC2_42_7]|nr:MAG: hypothetical protein A2007_04230 [Verrucomicrobia bacterium GWC2_42_7]
MDHLFIGSFLGYVAILVVLGVYFYRKQRGCHEFSLGNRSTNYWVTAIATHATDMSAWLFMGFPGVVFAKGCFATWTAIGLIIFMHLTWKFVAKRLRELTEYHGAMTLSSLFEKHYGDNSGIIKIISTLFALFFFILYISAGIVALGRALETVFGLSYTSGVLIGTFAVSAYTVLGGFMAIAWTDFFQGIFILFVVLLVPLFALNHVGGWEDFVHTLEIKNVSLTLLPDCSLSNWISIICMVAGWGLGYFGQPHILVNFMGIDKSENIKKAHVLGISWQVITLTSASFIGLVGIAFFPEGLKNNELVFISMAKVLFNPAISGLVLCAILAAAVTTMDSQILVSASILTEDVYKRFINKDAQGHRLTIVARLSALLITVLSLSLAFNNSKSIFSLIQYAWNGLGSTFGPLLLMTLYSKNVTRPAAISGIVAGGTTAILWPIVNLSYSEYAIIPGFLISSTIIFVVSRLTRRE